METDKQYYFNFPMVLLEGFMKLGNTQKCLDNSIAYSAYRFEMENSGGDMDGADELLRFQEYYDLKISDPQKLFERGKSLYESLGGGLPMAGISKERFFNFRNQRKEQDDKILLLAHLAFKSIIGSKPWYKVNNLLWLSRMDGKAKAVKDKSELSPSLRVYFTRHRMEKIKFQLSKSWGLIYYSRYTRGFYITYKLSEEKLIEIAEEKRLTYQMKRQRQETEQKRLAVLAKMKSTPK